MKLFINSRLERSVFLKNFDFFFFFNFLFYFLIFYLLEVRKFKENVTICVIPEKVRDLLLTFTSNNNTCCIVSKMNQHILFTLINTSYMILLVILLAKLSGLFSFCRE